MLLSETNNCDIWNYILHREYCWLYFSENWELECRAWKTLAFSRTSLAFSLITLQSMPHFISIPFFIQNFDSFKLLRISTVSQLLNNKEISPLIPHDHLGLITWQALRGLGTLGRRAREGTCACPSLFFSRTHRRTGHLYIKRRKKGWVQITESSSSPWTRERAANTC